MKTPVCQTQTGSSSTGSVSYSAPTRAYWNTTSANIGKVPIPIDCTIKSLRATVVTAPGAGKSWTFTILKNGSATDFSAVISGASQTDSLDDSHEASFSAGDIIEIKCTPSGNPAAPTRTKCQIMISAGANESLLLASSGTATVAAGQTVCSSPQTMSLLGSVNNNSTFICPTSGTFSNLVANHNTAPGADQSATWTLLKNLEDTALTCQVTGSNTIGSDTSHSVSVSAGDRISFKCVMSSGAATSLVGFGVKFSPEVDGESIVTLGASSNPSRSDSNYNYPLLPGSGSYTATETNAQTPFEAVTLKNLYIYAPTAPGAGGSGKSWTVTVRKNARATDLSAVISEASQSANDVSHEISVSALDLIGFQTTPTGTPATSYIVGGCVAYIEPETTSAKGFLTPNSKFWGA